MTQSSTSISRRGHGLRWLLLGLALLAVTLLLSGCPTGGPAVTAISPEDVQSLGNKMAQVETSFNDYNSLMETLPTKKFNEEINKRQNQLGFGSDALSNPDKATQARANFLNGYMFEVLKDYPSAVAKYTAARAVGNTPYTAQASYRLGILNWLNPKDLKGNTLGTTPDTVKAAKASLQTLRADFKGDIIVREPELAGDGGAAAFLETAPAEPPTAPTLYPTLGATAATSKLDLIYRTAHDTDTLKYNAMDTLVSFFRNYVSKPYGAVLALIALALIVKIITIPFTTATFRNLRDMQRIQPILKELQEKYSDDKQRLMEEQMKVYKEHKVNMFGGCLPMLIQFPILIIVWQAVNVYAYQFLGSSFLWVHSLAQPDLPLLVLYGISMIATQKLTATPSADPQQKAMQQQMTYLMPIMFVFLLQTIASAFVLYWFFLNVFSALHQYLLMRSFQQADAGKGGPTLPPTPPVKPAKPAKPEPPSNSNNLPRAMRRKRGM